MIGRQFGALVMMAAVVLLSTLVPGAEFDSFMWAYVIELLLTSLLGLGLERLAATDVAHGDRSRLGALFSARLVSLPLTVACVLALLAAVHEHLGLAATSVLVVWTAAVQVQGVLLAALRGLGRVGIEPALFAVARAVQAGALLGVAAHSEGLVLLLLAVALPDVAVAIYLVATVRPGLGNLRAAGLPWRLLGAYAVIEILGFAYLRADAVVVGHVLGATAGATYSLAYRVLDGLTAMVSPFILYLFPIVARLGKNHQGRERLRRVVLGWAPAGAVAIALLVMFGAPIAGQFVHRLADAQDALEVLLVTLPLYCFSAFELHLRSAEGRNRSPLILGALLLVTNVVMNLVLVPRYGIVAAAWVLVGCEATQAAWLATRLWRSALVERASLAATTASVIFLAITGALLGRGHLTISLAPAAACLVAVGFSANVLFRQLHLRPIANSSFVETGVDDKPPSA